MRSFILSSILILSIFSVKAQISVDADPDYYSFYPGTHLAIGRGVKPNDVMSALIPCVKFDKEFLEEGAISTVYNIYLVNNREELNYVLDIDAKASASALGVRGNLGFSFNSNQLFRKNAITFVISAKTEFGRLAMKPNVDLTNQAKSLLTDPSKFCAVCGTKFVSVERRGASVAAIITLDNLKDEEIFKLTAEAGGGGGIGPVSAQVSMKLKTYLKKYSEQGNVTVNIFSTGGQGFSRLEKLISSLTVEADAFDKIQNGLGDYIKGFDKTNAVPIGFHVTSFESLGLDMNNIDLWDVHKERKLRELQNMYKEYSEILDLARMILNRRNIRYEIFSKPEIDTLKYIIPSLNNTLITIADFHRKLKNNRIDINNIIVDKVFISEKIYEALTGSLAPKVYYQVVVDGDTLPQDKSLRAMELFYNSDDLLSSVKRQYPAAKKADHFVTIESPLLKQITLKLKPDFSQIKTNRYDTIKAETALFTIKIKSKKAIFDLYNIDDKYYPDKSFKNFDWPGFFIIEVEDLLNRKFEYKLFHASMSVRFDQRNGWSMAISNTTGNGDGWFEL